MNDSPNLSLFFFFVKSIFSFCVDFSYVFHNRYYRKNLLTIHERRTMSINDDDKKRKRNDISTHIKIEFPYESTQKKHKIM